MTTYQYANNNPIMFNDPLGNLSEAFVNSLTPGVKYVNEGNGTFDGNDGSQVYDTEDYPTSDGGGGTGGGGGGGGQNGTVYTVDNNGNIVANKNTGYRPSTGIQILFATGNSNYSTDDPYTIVNVSDTDLGHFNSGVAAGGVSYSYLNLNSATALTAGYALYSFLAKNTNVEWSLLYGKESYISTSHDPGSESGGEDLAISEMRRDGIQSVQLLLHDHPEHLGQPNNVSGLYGPSGYYLRDSQTIGDRAVAIYFNNYYSGNNILFLVLDITTGQIFNFSGGRIPDPSWYNFTGKNQPLRPGLIPPIPFIPTYK
jgi:hypothetical protein